MPLDNTNVESERTSNLRKARAVLANGFCRGLRSDGKGNHCALGALDAVCGQTVCGETPEVCLLAEFATYRGFDTYNNYRITGSAYPTPKIAAHNNMLGKEATLEMFDKAIAKSVQLDMEALVNA